MKPIATIALIAAAIISSAAQKSPPAPNVLQKQLQTKYDSMSTLVMRKDVAGLGKSLLAVTTPDFVYIDKKGSKINRAKLLDQMKQQMKMVKRFTRSGNKITAIVMKGGTAVVRVVSDFAMTFPGADGKPSNVTGQSTTLDTWVFTPTGWKLKAIKTLKESTKFNGKPG